MIEPSGPPASGAIALATETLRTFGQLRLRATGGSMLPAVHPGDVLRFESCTAGCVERGDIVLFQRDGQLVIHRVLARTESGLLTQGDALANPDPHVDNADVLGKMAGLSRNGRALPHRHRFRLGAHVGRWLLRRSSVATGLFIRWHRLSSRKAA